MQQADGDQETIISFFCQPTLGERLPIMNFRHLLEQHQLARQLFEAVNQWLSDAGIMMKVRPTCSHLP